MHNKILEINHFTKIYKFKTHRNLYEYCITRLKHVLLSGTQIQANLRITGGALDLITLMDFKMITYVCAFLRIPGGV